jgi:hypothetical protein
MPSRIILLLAVPLLLSACGDSSKKDPTSPGALSGNWQMSLQKANSTLAPKTQSGFLSQSGETISGSLMFTDIPCSGIGSVNGTVTGSNISFEVLPTGVTVNLTGTVGSGQSSMSGNYTILSTGCSGSQSAPQTGTWTANLVTPLKGNIQGTLSSKTHNTSYALTGSISQGANNGTSNAPLTGTISATGYCFTSVNIAGAISGTSVAINLVDADGVEVGQVNGASSLDGTTVTGTYQVLGLGKGAAAGCVDGDSGTMTLTLG